jgi:catecholate siderophore receptor
MIKRRTVSPTARLLGCSILALGFVSPAHADEAAEAETYALLEEQSGDIIVTGADDGYRTISSTSGTKTDTPLIDVPQAISVVTAEQLSDQQIRSVADLVRLTPGLSAGQGEGHRDQVTFRGNNSTADFFVDGLRDDVQYFRSFYNVERVEVHKGPNAMVFGRGGGGGLLNRITKGPISDRQLIGLTLSGDSFGSGYAAADVNVPIGDAAAFRINGFYERLDNHRDAFDGDRYAVNPVIGGTLGESVRVQIGYEYVNDERVIDRGIPSAVNGTLATPAGPVAGFRDAFFGVRGINRTEFEAHVGTARVEADVSDSLTLSAQALYGDYDKLYTNVFPATAVRTATSGAFAGQQVIGVEAYADPTTRQTAIGQVNAIWRGDTGGIGHVLLIGAEITDQSTRNERINGFFSPALTSASRRTDILFRDPASIPTPTFVAGPTGNSNRAVRSELDQLSFYIQDQIALSDAVELVAGLRYDRFDLTATNLFTGQAFARTDDLWSPRVGLVVKPVPDASVYVSYTKSFLPQSGDQFIGLDLTSAALEPEAFDNYEVGAKWDIWPGLSLTAAVFRLDRSNTRSVGPVAGSVVLSGEQRSSGVEIGLTGKLTNDWQVAFGYARVKAEISSTTAAAPAGRTVAQVPRHQISLWNRYDVSDRIGVGLGIYHQSSSFATISNATRLPGYTRVDAALFVTIAEGVDAQVNVENLLGERYFPNAHNDNNISTGAPRNARLTVNFAF